MPRSWTRLRSRVVYENAWIRVREDDVVRPDGREGIYAVLDTHSPAVFIVALTERGEVVLIVQERYTTGADSIEIPAGATDGEPPLTAARRELREEAGLAAGTWRELGRLHSMNGTCSEQGHVFLATDLVAGQPDKRAEEGITEVRTVPFPEVVGMISRGEITDGQTVSALALAGAALGRFA